MQRNNRRKRREEPAIDAPTQARAYRMERKLREYHRIGAEVAELKTPDIPRLAEKARVTVHLLRRMRTFARQYTANELEVLCALRRPNGLPLQWGHVNYLLVVKNKRQRSALEKRAASEGWTAPVLNAAIPVQYRTERPHGRKMANPTSAAAGLRTLVAEGEFWLRRLDVVAEVGRKTRNSHRSIEFQEAAGHAVALMKTMQKELRKAIAWLSAGST